MLIFKNEYDFFIVGLPMYQGYYANHNYANSTIGFAPLVDSGKDFLTPGVVPLISIMDAGKKKPYAWLWAIFYWFVAINFYLFVIYPILGFSEIE